MNKDSLSVGNIRVEDGKVVGEVTARFDALPEKPTRILVIGRIDRHIRFALDAIAARSDKPIVVEYDLEPLPSLRPKQADAVFYDEATFYPQPGPQERFFASPDYAELERRAMMHQGYGARYSAGFHKIMPLEVPEPALQKPEPKNKPWYRQGKRW